MLKSLMSNSLFDESQVFVFADGPKENATVVDIAKIGAVKKLFEPLANNSNVTLCFSEKNRGLTTSIVSGISEIVNRYGKVIVIEDDLELSHVFLNYMNDALNLYENEERVMHIGGYMVPHNKDLSETFFLKAPTIWGWGTWKRAWNKFEVDAKILLKKLEEKFGKDFSYKLDVNGTYNYTKQLNDIASGKLDTWDIQWSASIYLYEGLCLHPNNSLSKNNGFDGSGVHCYPSELFKNQKLSSSSKVKLQPLVIEDTALEAFTEFFKCQNLEDELIFMKKAGIKSRIKHAVKKLLR